ncbi:CRISPR-associated protein Cmr6 [Paenibacillus shirakamiensis]|uniref:CRISPR-associated protein Cmr6 n=1 Tax=Paenibacillus shirakamiensis TaxID=1265935 RepID=A0ABS4JDR3_9BACL|nr:type III-B CRISPR module RAMP protein Cmr6 [Paenibacillus shirakamiensis]MBP1999091.1 CRISPR-associated protein Cmr6 [Paenibacillus shirakamiensis]
MNAYLELHKSQWSLKPFGPTLDQVVQKSEKKSEFYSDFIEFYIKSWDREKYNVYQKGYERYYNMRHFGNHVMCSFLVRSISPLAVGHGGVSILETNLSLHPIYGIPYIPASALKGLAARYASHTLSLHTSALGKTEYDYQVLFGTEGCAGYVHFHDAWITPSTAANSLKQDVLTPHHQLYNQISVDLYNDTQDYPAPSDMDSPIPIPFLIAKGEFTIALSFEGNEAEATPWLNLAKDILVEALHYEGIGAKTNAGYGVFVEINGEQT